ncbi:MAG: hypothetical protein RL441_1437 [Actinomycetota bacterium]
MDYRNGLSDDDGSISGEAAIGIACIVLVAMMLIQALGVGLWQLRAHSVLAEAVRVATASGEPERQLAIAREFITDQLPTARLNEEVTEAGVRFELRQRLRLSAIGWQPTLSASGSGTWQDAWQW